MKKNILHLISLALMLSLATSCRDTAPNITNPKDVYELKNWSGIFESFWQGMNQNYNFWDVDTTDWDRIHRVYKPKFEALPDTVNAKTVCHLFEEITSGLIDMHYYLILKDIGVSISPGMEQIKQRDYYHPQTPEFHIQLINNVLRPRKPEMKDVQLLHKIKGYKELVAINYSYKDIAFLHFNHFSFNEIIDDNNKEDIYRFADNFIDLAFSDKTKGIVIDLRHNGGGIVDDIKLLFGDFIPEGESLQFGYNRYKNGPGRLDFTPLIKAFINGTGEKPFKQKPVVVLIDLYSASCSEMTTFLSKELFSDVTVIGERSLGGHGQLITDSYMAGGQFENDFIFVYTPSSIFLPMDKVLLEGYGITPDIEVLYDEASFLKGNDRQLDTAIEYLQGKMK